MPPSSALLARLALHLRLFLRPFATQDSPSSIQDVARSCGIPLQAKLPTMTPAVAVTISVRHFVPGQYVDIAGITIGKGFQGAMKRWGFPGMPAPHGASLSHRSLGSTLGKMAGRMGGKHRIVKSVWVYKIDPARNLMWVQGQPWFSSQVRGVSILRAAHVNGERQGKYNDIIMKVKDLNNQDKGTTVLSGDVFDVPIRQDIVHRVVCWQLAKRRQGTHSTKTISEVSGTGKKPYQQKGTGRARHGTLRGPQFRHGATMHGPKPRNYEYKLPKKVRRLGLKIALSARVVEGKLVLVDNIVPATHKTKEIATYISGLTECKKVLFVDGADKVNTNLCRSTSNLHFADVLPAKGLNVYSILQHDTLVMTIDAVRQIEERMHTPISR